MTRRRMLELSGLSGALALTASAHAVVRTDMAREFPEEKKLGLAPLPKVSAKAEALLDEIEERGSRFFYEQAGKRTGQVRDHAPVVGAPKNDVASIASTGFGLTALCMAHQRGYLPAGACEARVEKTLRFLVEECPHVHGFLYHFLNTETAAREWKCEVSSIDTALLLCGVLTARQYFAGNRRIEEYATRFYERVNWQWMMNGGDTLSMGWYPETGFIKARWNTYSELMAMCLMAIGSPTYPVPAGMWEKIARPRLNYGGIEYITNMHAPLFIHQYAHAWVDFRGQRDRYANYFTNSIAATRAHQLWCLVEGRKFPWMDENLWGITASDTAQGYSVRGGPPTMGDVEGTVVPTACGGSLVFLPRECAHVLGYMREKYPRSWTRYGFVDAFQPEAGWYAPDVLGIDQGPMVVMAENLRTGWVWKYFMRNREIGNAMQAVGFRADRDADREVL
ncbi:MAG: glucoamylase family protein [Acidobacteriaceae bacterium]